MIYVDNMCNNYICDVFLLSLLENLLLLGNYKVDQGLRNFDNRRVTQFLSKALYNIIA